MRASKGPPILRIASGTFYRQHPSSTTTSASLQANPPFFANLNFELPSSPSETPRHWCIVGPSLSGKTTFLQILRGQHISIPPTARSFPYLSTEAVPARLRSPHRAIQYVGFDGEQTGGVGGPATSAYIAARYESRREDTDFSLRDFLEGNMELNPLKPQPGDKGLDDAVSGDLMERVVRDLRLDALLDLPVAFLSNGQGRRARIARALLKAPEVLLLDEPFMGLDPPTVASLSPLLHSMAERAAPRLVLTARPQDAIPDWITHLVYLRTDCQVESMGEKGVVLEGLRKYVQGVWKGGLKEDGKLPIHALLDMGRTLTSTGVLEDGVVVGEEKSQHAVEGTASVTTDENLANNASKGEALVEMDGCQVRYGDKIALGNWSQQTSTGPKSGLIWTIRRGERWGVFGPNGSGKTTIVSLLCSDHPQTYSLPIKLFGRSRLPEPGSGERPLTFWDVQARIGHSSPEVHQHMPTNLTVRQVLENAWANTFKGIPQLDETAKAKVDATLRWFEPELNPLYHSSASISSRTATEADSSSSSSSSSSSQKDPLSWSQNFLFGKLPFSAQRTSLFLRAVIKNPDIVVLDESFGGMDEAVRDKCILFLSFGEAKTYNSQGKIVDSEVARKGEVVVRGLSGEQALICISHVKEEVPDCVREWICLPEANSGVAARFGGLDGPLRRDEKRWRDIWGV